MTNPWTKDQYRAAKEGMMDLKRDIDYRKTQLGGSHYLYVYDVVIRMINEHIERYSKGEA